MFQTHTTCLCFVKNKSIRIFTSHVVSFRVENGMSKRVLLSCELKSLDVAFIFSDHGMIFEMRHLWLTRQVLLVCLNVSDYLRSLVSKCQFLAWNRCQSSFVFVHGFCPKNLGFGLGKWQNNFTRFLLINHLKCRKMVKKKTFHSRMKKFIFENGLQTSIEIKKGSNISHDSEQQPETWTKYAT